MRRSLACVLLLIGALISGAADPPAVVQGTDHFEFVYRVKLPEIQDEARLWIPLPRTDNFQTVTLLESDLPVESKKVSDRDYGNEICVVNAKPADSGKTVAFRYKVVRKEKTPYAEDRAETSRFLQPEKLVPADATFKTLASKATKGKATEMERARALYDHVLGRMKYDKTGDKWGRGDAMYACDARTGNCTDFHAYFIALARSAGLPARFAIGATIPADRDEGVIEGYHCWAEVYVGDRWLPVDISEAWKNPKLADYYFGHQPANRFELSKGRDLIVDPAPSSGPINFLVYPLMERDGQVGKAETTFSFRRTSA